MNVTEIRNDIQNYKSKGRNMSEEEQRRRGQTRCSHMDKMIDVFVLTQLMKVEEREVIVKSDFDYPDICWKPFVAKSKASDTLLTCPGGNFISQSAKEVTSSKIKVVGTLEERAYYDISFVHLTNALSVTAHSIFI